MKQKTPTVHTGCVGCRDLCSLFSSQHHMMLSDIAYCLLYYCYRCNVRIYALIPVKESLCIDHIADLEFLYSLINICCIVTQIRLYGKGIGRSIYRDIKVQVVSVLAGTIPVVRECNILSIGILSGCKPVNRLVSDKDDRAACLTERP